MRQSMLSKYGSSREMLSYRLTQIGRLGLFAFLCPSSSGKSYLPDQIAFLKTIRSAILKKYV